MNTIYQHKGWKRTLASWIYNKVCCKLWGHANGKRITEDQAEFYAKGEAHGLRTSGIKHQLAMGKEIRRLCCIIEKKNRKIRSLKATLSQQNAGGMARELAAQDSESTTDING